MSHRARDAVLAAIRDHGPISFAEFMEIALYGPGGFYDDLGDPKRQPHLVRGEGFDTDPAFYVSSLVSFGFRGAGPDPSLPRSWPSIDSWPLWVPPASASPRS